MNFCFFWIENYTLNEPEKAPKVSQNPPSLGQTLEGAARGQLESHHLLCWPVVLLCKPSLQVTASWLLLQPPSFSPGEFSCPYARFLTSYSLFFTSFIPHQKLSS